jgi:integrase
MFGCMDTPEAVRPRVRREQPLIARLRLATARLADADRERMWAIVVATEAGLSIRTYVRLAAHRCPSLAATQVTPHVLRHTCAMMILQATGDLRNVSRWLGHADMHMTEVSLRADPTDTMDAMEGMIPPALRRGRLTVPDTLIASGRGA